MNDCRPHGHPNNERALLLLLSTDNNKQLQSAKLQAVAKQKIV